MAFWAYMLRCSDGTLYVGHTDAIESRIASHQIGRGCDYTARRQPVTFAWAEAFPSRIEALEAERRIKGWSRAKKEAPIAGDWGAISRLAVSRGARPSTSSGRTEEGEWAPDPARPEKSEQPHDSVRSELVEGRATNGPPAP